MEPFISETSVMANIRSLLISVQEPITLRKLQDDYLQLIGKRIPYRDLGYQNLESLLKKHPDVAQMSRFGMDIKVRGVADESTQHLANLVARSRPSTSRSRGRGKGSSFHGSGFNTYSAPPLRMVPKPNALRLRQHFQAHQQVFPPKPQQAPVPRSQVTQSQTSKRSKGELPPRFVKQQMGSSLRVTVSNSESRGAGVDAAASGSGQKSAAMLRNHSLNGLVASAESNNIGASASQSSALASHSFDIGYTAADEPALIELAADAIEAASPPVSPAATPAPEEDAVPQLTPSSGRRPPKHVHSPREESFKTILSNYCQKYDLGEPLYTSTLLGKSRMYIAKLKIQEKSFICYPSEYRTSALSEEAVARIAVEELSPLLTKQRGSSYPTTDSIDKMVFQLTQLLEGYTQGLFSSEVIIEYQEQFKEELPTQWMDWALESGQFSFTTGASNLCIVKYTPQAMEENYRNAEIPSTLPPALILPEEDYIDVTITEAVNGAEVAVRIVGENYNDKCVELMTDMEMFYLNETDAADTLEVGKSYVAKTEDTCHRVILQSYNPESQTALCYLPDHGTEEVFAAMLLFPMHPKFLQLAYQAKKLRIPSLEEFEDSVIVHKELMEWCNKVSSMIAVLKSGNNPDVLYAELYDTSTDQEVDIQVSDKAIEKVYEIVNSPQLLQENVVDEGYITHVISNGLVYIRLPQMMYSEVENLVRHAVSQMNEADLGVDEVKKHDYYLAKSHNDNNWYRATPVSCNPNALGCVQMQFIDFGHDEEVSLGHLCPMKPKYTKLMVVPRQITECQLSDVTEISVERFWQLAPKGKPVLVKLIASVTKGAGRKGGSKVLPQVQLFRRVPPNNMLLLINVDLSNFDSFNRMPEGRGDNNNNVKNSSALERRMSADGGVTSDTTCVGKAPSRSIPTSPPPPHSSLVLNGVLGMGRRSSDGDSTRACTSAEMDDLAMATLLAVMHLPQPPFPPVGEFFDVVVYMAANPTNFVVQALQQKEQLLHLMREMKKFYSSEEKKPLEPCLPLINGAYYASLHEDGYWYRVKVQVLNKVNVTVFYVDYGDYALVPVERVQPLAPQFCHLPMQVYPAKLAGVKPANGDWSVKDCLRFHQLAADKCFVSVVCKVNPDELHPEQTCLELSLVDTSDPEKDVSLADLLVEEGRALLQSPHASPSPLPFSPPLPPQSPPPQSLQRSRADRGSH